MDPVTVAIVVGVAALVLALLFGVARRRRSSAASGRVEAHDVAAARAQFGPGPCHYGGCNELEGWLCVYRDRSGRKCNTRWCKKHVEMIGSAPYCHRHASIVNALSGTEGSILEVKSQPNLEDRAVPLLTLIADRADKPVMDLLARLAAEHPEVQVAKRKAVQEVWVGSERIAWQVNWGLYTNVGYLLRIALRAGVPEPPVVQALVSNKVVFEAVPTWIARRLRGEPHNPTDQADFCDQIVAAITANTGGKTEEVDRLVEIERDKFGTVQNPRY